MALPLASILGSVAVNAATPYLSKVLGGVFGVDEAERKREQALAEIDRVAQGGTTQGQAGIAYARGRALSDLASMAQRGTAQQQAGLQRAAMQQGADIQAQYAAQLAELRSREQERARQMGGFMREQAAAQEAKRRRDALAGAVGGALGGLTKIFTGTEAGGASGDKLTEEEANAYNQAQASNRKDPFAAWNASVAEPTAAGEGLAAVAATPSPGKATSADVAAFLGEPKRVMSTLTYEQRTGIPRVTQSEMAPQRTLANLRQERANAIPSPMSVGRAAVLGPASSPQPAPAAEGGDTFANLADRSAIQASFAPTLMSPAQQPAMTPMTPTVEPMAFSYQGEQTENLRKQRPGRMPRRPAMKKIPGGGGFAL